MPASLGPAEVDRSLQVRSPRERRQGNCTVGTAARQAGAVGQGEPAEGAEEPRPLGTRGRFAAEMARIAACRWNQPGTEKQALARRESEVLRARML